MDLCKKLFKTYHENTKVRKHEKRHRNELSSLRQDFSDRMNRIYMIFIYPVDPVKKWNFLYYQVTDILFVFS